MWAEKKSATNVTVAQRASHSTSETIVISEADVAKIRKDAETAIGNDEKIRQHMDIMVDNQLKNMREDYESILKVKGTRLDATGVRVAYQLDAKGQEIMKVVKNNRDLTLEAIEAERLSVELNTPVRIITDAEGAASLPTVRQRRAKGFWSEKDGIVVVLSNHKDVADVAGTVLHEIIGHDGLRVLFPLRA